MPTDTRTDAAGVLRTTESLLKIATDAAPKLPPPWGFVLSALSAAAGLAADLIGKGLDPTIAIATMRSALADVDDVRKVVDDLIADKSRPAE